MRSIFLCCSLLFGIVMISSCSKKSDPAPVKGDFKASWTENDNGTTYTCTGSFCKVSKKILTLYASPGVGITRNVTFYLADTVANTYTVGKSGTGSTAALLNGVNGPDGKVFFNSTSGTFVITEKQPTWISGTFEVKGNATSGPLEKIKGSFQFVTLSR